MVVLRSFVDVLSFGLWYYWIAMVGLLYGCVAQDSPRLPTSSNNAGSMLKRFLKRLIRGRYHGLNGLDKKMEAYLGYDNGYFVELGANDGVSQSNTLYFEKPSPLEGPAGRAGAAQLPAVPREPVAGQQHPVRGLCLLWLHGRIRADRLLQPDVHTARPGHRHRRSAGPCAVRAAFLGQSEDVFEYGAVARTLNDLLRRGRRAGH
jgi:hypothetical protein